MVDEAPTTEDGPALLIRLLNTCSHLAHQAGLVIRAVQLSREESGGDCSDNIALGASLKDASDTRSYLTTADLRAQKVIFDGLRIEFPGLALVGEEEEDEEDDGDGTAALANPESWYPNPTTVHADPTAPSAADLPAEYNDLTLEELVVFVDPVDGTREFVEGRLDAVQTLIGVSWRGRAVAGVIGLPFHDGAIGRVVAPPSRSAGVVLRGIVGTGLLGLGLDVVGGIRTERLVVAASKTVKEKVLKDAHAILGGETIVAGGCGNKILRLLTGRADAALFNLGTSLWDTCATEACLVACGGQMTTLLGTPIEHARGVPVENRLGVVATAASFEEAAGRTHRKLCAEFVSRLNGGLADLVEGISGGGTDQALDIARSIDGQPFGLGELSAMLGGPICSYCCHEADAVRYKQSVASRVQVFQPTAPEGQKEKTPKSFFYKRAVLRELPYAMEKARKYPYKIRRDVRANVVETNFLSSDELKAFVSSVVGTEVALPYRVEQKAYPDANPIDSRFGLCLRDFSPHEGWRQEAHLKRRELRCALGALAEWHAFFWVGRGPCPQTTARGKQRVAMGNLAKRLWPTASYWHLGQQPAGQIDRLRPNWERLRAEFGFPEEWHLGERLESVALEASLQAHGLDTGHRAVSEDEWANAKYRTIIHGDPKAPNFFFRAPSGREASGRGDADGDRPELGVIDFQWSGLGLGAVDVAYCIAASADLSVFVAEGGGTAAAAVQPYIDEYYAALLEASARRGDATGGGPEELSKKAFQEQFEWATIDLARVIVGDHWSGLTKDVLVSREGKMSYNACNKSAEVGYAMMELADDYISRRKCA